MATANENESSMKKEVVFGTKDPEVLAQTRRLYKVCVECVKLVDQSTKDKRKFEALFKPDVIAVRFKLREAAERLLFLNPIEYGRKAEDLIWKKCFYEPIQILRLNKLKLDDEGKGWMGMLLQAAIGYYHSFLLRLELKLCKSSLLSAHLDFPSLLSASSNNTSGEGKSLEEWTLEAAHKTFIYLGDIARYQLELEGFGTEMAIHYYRQALSLKPDHGMGHNQLGTLLRTKDYAVHSAYHYLRCIEAKESYDGAVGNFLQVMKQNKELYSLLETTTSETDKEFLKKFLIRLLHLIFILWDDNKDDLMSELQPLCQKTVSGFDQFFNQYHGEEEGSDEETSVTSEMVGNLMLMQMVVILKLHSAGSVKLSPAIATFVSMFSSMLRRTISLISKEVEEDETNNTNGASTELCNGQVEESGKREESVVKEVGVRKEKKRRKKKKFVLRRRRRDTGSSDADEEGSTQEYDTTESEGESEGEEVVSEGEDVIELEIEESDGEHTENPVLANHNTNNTQTNTTLGNNTSVGSYAELSVGEKIKTLENLSLISVVKLCFDFLRCNSIVITTVSQQSVRVSSGVWSTVSEFLNLIPTEKQISTFVASDPYLTQKISEELETTLESKWQQKRPLTEDFCVRGLGCLSDLHSKLDFANTPKISSQAECLIRLMSLRFFGVGVGSVVSPGLVWKDDKWVFGTPIKETSQGEEGGGGEGENQQHDMMRNMAKLRLKEELARLDTIGWIPVYLAPLSGVLMGKLPQLKDLVKLQKFVTVIPKSVIQELDREKKESSNAREAIRWLEYSFLQGTKYLRAQKDKEYKPFPTHPFTDYSVSEKNELEGMLHCCAYLGGTLPSNRGTTTVVTILTDSGPASDQFKQLQTLLKETGILGANIQNIHCFLSEWRKYKKSKKGG